LNLNHFKIFEDMVLNIIASKSTWMALSPYQISWKSTGGSKVISGGHTERSGQNTNSSVKWSMFQGRGYGAVARSPGQRVLRPALPRRRRTGCSAVSCSGSRHSTPSPGIKQLFQPYLLL
jgi:hypothetical protein